MQIPTQTLLTINKWVLLVELLESGLDDPGKVGKNLGEIVGKEGAKSPNKPYTFGATTIEPVKAMHRILWLEHLGNSESAKLRG